MSRRKEVFSTELPKVVEWISRVVILRKNNRGEIIKASLAKELGVSKSAINDFEIHGVPASTVLRVAKRYSISLDELFFGGSLDKQKQEDSLTIGPLTLNSKHFIEVNIALPVSWVEDNIKGRQLQAWAIDTTVLEPEIKKGEIALINPDENKINASGFYAIQFGEDRLLIRKFLIRADNTVEETMFNPFRIIPVAFEAVNALRVYGRVEKIIKDV